MRNLNSCSKPPFENFLSEEQISEVIEAILAGKYSWACVLVLRFIGYNPLHYIPYRTYNRLVKEHCPNSRQYGKTISTLHQCDELGNHSNLSQPTLDPQVQNQQTLKLIDLNHLDELVDQQARVRGGA